MQGATRSFKWWYCDGYDFEPAKHLELLTGLKFQVINGCRQSPRTNYIISVNIGDVGNCT